jgi:hypothetical protein
MPTFTWKITNVTYTLKPDLTPDRVTQIAWICVGEEGGRIRDLFDSTVHDADATTFTEAEAIAVVQAANPQVEPDITEWFERDLTPTVGVGLPWESQFPIWSPTLSYDVGDRVNYNGLTYECIQAHASQPDWAPPRVPALFSVVQDPGIDKKIWVAGEAVAVDDTRWFPDVDGTEYIVIQAHTTQVGWEPPNVPALWGIV